MCDRTLAMEFLSDRTRDKYKKISRVINSVALLNRQPRFDTIDKTGDRQFSTIVTRAVTLERMEHSRLPFPGDDFVGCQNFIVFIL